MPNRVRRDVARYVSTLTALIGRRFLKEFPQLVVRHGCGDVYLRLADWMHELYAAGVERETAVGIAARIAVFEVAFDGAADVGELAAYLMVATRQECNFPKVITV